MLCVLLEGRKAGKTAYKNPDFIEAATEEKESHRGAQYTLKYHILVLSQEICRSQNTATQTGISSQGAPKMHQENLFAPICCSRVKHRQENA